MARRFSFFGGQNGDPSPNVIASNENERNEKQGRQKEEQKFLVRQRSCSFRHRVKSLSSSGRQTSVRGVSVPLVPHKIGRSELKNETELVGC